MEEVNKKAGYEVTASRVEKLEGEYPNPINERPDFNAMFDKLISQIEERCKGKEYIIYEWSVCSFFAPCEWNFPCQVSICWGLKGDEIPDKYKLM